MSTTMITRAIRTLSTASDNSTVSNALTALGSILQHPSPPTNTTTTTTTNTKTTSSTSITPTRTPPIINIPPAQDPLLHYLTSRLLHHGHRAKAARITSRTLLYLHAFTRAQPLPILRAAVLAASPAVRSMTHRQGTKNVVKPVALGEKQRTRFALQWILKASEKKSGKTVEERLARELIAVVQGNSEALKRKEEVHRFAMVNRGNAQWRV